MNTTFDPQRLTQSIQDYRTKFPSEAQSVSEMLKVISRRSDEEGLMLMCDDLDQSVKRGAELTQQEFWSNVNGQSSSEA